LVLVLGRICVGLDLASHWARKPGHRGPPRHEGSVTRIRRITS